MKFEDLQSNTALRGIVTVRIITVVQSWLAIVRLVRSKAQGWSFGDLDVEGET